MPSRPDVNPFSAVLDPSGILAACEKSLPLSGLSRRVHCKLDEPSPRLAATVQEYDDAVEAGKSGGRFLPASEPTVLDSLRAAHPAIGSIAGVRWG